MQRNSLPAMVVLGAAAAVATVYMAQLLSRYRSRRRGLPDPLAAGVGNNPAAGPGDGKTGDRGV